MADLGAAANITPWGAALNAVGAAVSAPAAPSTAVSSSGSTTVGGLSFGGDHPTESALMKGLAIGAGVLVLSLLLRR